MGGELGRGGAELLEACRSHIQAMPVSRVCLDLSALADTDTAGASDLFAICRRLRLDGFQVEIYGVQAQVSAVLRELGLSLGKAGLCVPASHRRGPAGAGDGSPDGPTDAA
jgi:anti-anti-sigma regulatory factor